MMKQQIKLFKEKKFLKKDIKICISCGGDELSLSKYTLHCRQCGHLNFYEAV